MRKAIALIFLLLPGAAWATPSITNVVGTIADGEPITITWTGMPAAGPTIALFDDFENGSVGATIATGTASTCKIGKWDGYFGAILPYYASTVAVSGSRCMQADLNVTAPSGDHGLIRRIATNDGVYIAWNAQVPAGDQLPGRNAIFGGSAPDYLCNWKMTWLYDTSIDATGPNIFFPAIGGSSSVVAGSNDITSVPRRGCYYFNPAGTSPSGNANISTGAWKHYDYYMKNACDGTGLAAFWYTFRPGTISKASTFNVASTNSWPSGYSMTNLAVGAYGRNSANVGYVSHPSYDDVYIATGTNALAHAFIGDASTFLTCSTVSVLTHTSWGAASGAFTVRQGSFATSQSVYMFLMDEAGNVSSGFPVTVGSVSGDPGPGVGSTSRTLGNTVRFPFGRGSAYKVRTR